MSEDEITDAKSYSAPALEKGLDVLEDLAERAVPVSARELAESLGRSKNELFRMIHVLIARGYVERDADTDEISLTNKLFGLGLRTPQSKMLLNTALPELKRLAEKFHQTPHLLIVHKGRTVTLAHVSANADFTFNLNTGYGRPAAEATTGRVIMAFQSEEKLRQIMAESEKTSTNRINEAEFFKSIEAIRERGYAYNKSTDFVGVTDICCPILGEDGHALACLIFTCIDRIDKEIEYEAMLAELMTSCKKIGGRL